MPLNQECLLRGIMIFGLMIVGLIQIVIGLEISSEKEMPRALKFLMLLNIAIQIPSLAFFLLEILLGRHSWEEYSIFM